MKWITSMIILSLMVTSLKLLPAMHAMSDLLASSESTHSCCSKKANTCDTASMEKSMDESSDEDTKDCCQDGDCHCLCCLHIVYCKSIEAHFFVEDIVDASQHNWKFNYFKDFNYSIFHPPLV